MAIDPEKYTLFFVALCTLILTTTVVIYCHQAERSDRQGGIQDVRVQVQELRDRVAGLVAGHMVQAPPYMARRPTHPPPPHVDKKKVYATLYHNPSEDPGYVLGLRYAFFVPRLAFLSSSLERVPR